MSTVDSTLKAAEMVPNKDRKFGSANEYFPCFFEKDGKKIPMLFTEHEVVTAMERAKKNPEDISEEDAEKGFLHWLFG